MTKEKEYERFGSQWRAYVMKKSKSDLVDMYRKVCIELQQVKSVGGALPSESECTKLAEEAANMYPPEQWTDGFERGYERGMIAVIEMIKEKLQGN